MAEEEVTFRFMYLRCNHCHRTRRVPEGLFAGQAVVRCPGCGRDCQLESTASSRPPASAALPEPTRPSLNSSAPTAAASPASAADTGTTEFEATLVPDAPRPLRSGAAQQPVEANGSHQEEATFVSVSSPAPAAVVPSYTILGELGRGAMGVVFKARHEKLKRVVALKMILAGPLADRANLARFQAEAEAVARLHHSGIIQVYEVGEQHGQPYLALEFVAGGTLKARLDGRPQPVRAAAQLIELVARAIHAAHLRGIIHRDLKPANILLAPATDVEADGSLVGHREALQVYGAPKITDFGLAKQLDRQDTGATQQGDILGTPAYMAPEQAGGQTVAIGPAVDVYALGAILYEMLTGRPPFQAPTVLELLDQVTSQAPLPPRRLVRGLSRDLETICLKCLAKEPHKRYRSALALADDLHRFLNGEPIQARRASFPERLWSWCLRNPVAASLVLTVTLVLGLGLWHLTQLSDDLMSARAEKDVQQQTQLLLKTMKCYSDTVVKGARAAGLKPTTDFRETKVGIPFPFAFTMELTEYYKGNADVAMEMRVYSDHPFHYEGPNYTANLDDWEREALEQLREKPSEPVKTFTVYKSLPSLRYATAIVMRKDCVTCHNQYSTKHDWREGDVRGALEVIRPLAADIEDTNQRLRGTYALLGGAAVVLLALCGLVLTIGRRYRRS